MTKVSEAEFLLSLDETALIHKLGVWNFQVEQYGKYDPNKILKADFFERGEKAFQKYLAQVKDTVCEFWNNHKDSDLFEDSMDVYFFIIGILFASKVPYYAATFFGAILIKRGLSNIC